MYLLSHTRVPHDHTVASSHERSHQDNKGEKFALSMLAKESPSILTQFPCHEQANKAFLARLLSKKGVLGPTDAIAVYHYYKRLNSNNTATVTYAFSPSKWYGRVYPEDGLSLGLLKDELRYALVHESLFTTNSPTYVHIELVDCGYRILLDLVEYHMQYNESLRSRCIRDYVHSPQSYIEEVISVCSTSERKVTVDEARDLFSLVLNGGSVAVWIAKIDLKIAVPIQASLMFNKLFDEVNACFEVLIQQVYFEFAEDVNGIEFQLCQEALEREKKRRESAQKKHKKYVSSSPCVTTSTISEEETTSKHVKAAILQEFERRIVEHLVDYCKSNGLIDTSSNNFVYCFDSLLLPYELFHVNHLLKMEQDVLKHLGFTMKLQLRENALRGGDLYLKYHDRNPNVKHSPYSPTSKALCQLDQAYFDALELYDVQKLYFEKFVCKINKEACNHIEVWKEFHINDKCIFNTFHINNLSLEKKFGTWKTSTIELEKDKETDELYVYVKTNQTFLKEYLKDDWVKEYNTYSFNPCNASESQLLKLRSSHNLHSEEFNTFMGYHDLIIDEKLPMTNDDNVDEEVVMAVTKEWRSLVFQLVGGKRNYFRWYLSLLSAHLCEPAAKIPLAVCIQGRQGGGKSSHLKPLSYIVNHHYFLETDRIKDIAGDFSDIVKDKLWLLYNEADTKKSSQHQSAIKSFISEEIKICEQKGAQGVKPLHNHVLLIATSNKPNALAIDMSSGNRRIAVFLCTDVYVHERSNGAVTEYTWELFWLPLRRHFESMQFLRCLYYFLTVIVHRHRNHRLDHLPNNDAIKKLKRNSFHYQLREYFRWEFSTDSHYDQRRHPSTPTQHAFFSPKRKHSLSHLQITPNTACSSDEDSLVFMPRKTHVKKLYDNFLYWLKHIAGSDLTDPVELADFKDGLLVYVDEFNAAAKRPLLKFIKRDDFGASHHQDTLEASDIDALCEIASGLITDNLSLEENDIPNDDVADLNLIAVDEEVIDAHNLTLTRY